MDKLSTAEQAELKKNSTERLKFRLYQAGVDEEKVLAMDRAGLLNAVAELKLNPLGATGGAEKPPAIWEQELAFRREQAAREEARWQAEMEFRQKEMEVREIAARVEREQREIAARAEREQAAREEDRWRREMEFREAEARRQEIREREAESSLIGRTTKFANAIKNIFPSMPADSAELPSYLENVDNLFQLYDVPTDLKSRLLLSHLTGRAKSIVSKLPFDQLACYDDVKSCLLKEFQVTPRELRSRFVNAAKKPDESYAVFRSRLAVTFSHYMKCRNVSKLDDLVDLLVADKLKDTLLPGALRYVLGVEGNKRFTSHEVANAADVYCSHYNKDDSYKGETVSNLSMHGYNSKPFTKTKFFAPKTGSNGATGYTGSKGSHSHNGETVVKSADFVVNEQHPVDHGRAPQNGNGNGTVFTNKKWCHICKTNEHYTSKCSKKAGTRANANACVVEHTATVAQPTHVYTADRDIVLRTAEGNAVNCQTSARTKVIGLPASLHSCEIVPDYDCTVNDCSDIFDREFDSCIVEPIPEVKLAKLNYVDVVINGKTYRALNDSGAEMPLIKSGLLDDISYIGSINIQPIVGKAVPANLAVLDVAKYDTSVEASDNLQGNSTKRPLHLIFAVTDLAEHDVVLPEPVVRDLQETSHRSTGVCKETESTLKHCGVQSVAAAQHINVNEDCNRNSSDNAVVADIASVECTDDNDIMNVDMLDTTDIKFGNVDSTSRDKLISDQRSDVSLKASRSLADHNKGGYKWIDGILYHSDKILNTSVMQIVAPANRRADILALAHDQHFHQGHKKTSERIRCSFYWPTLRSDVINYVASCEPCMLKRRLVKKDRVPISPIDRPGLPGEHIMMDIIGPIEPKSSMGHKYILNVICLHSRWPFSYVLRNINSNSICDCLFDVFSYLGVASTISSDCGSNFTSSLTTTFLERMGCTPRFNTPAHPEASGAVERLNQTFKRMLHHAITNHSRQWHKCIPFILWTLRESGNETTGLPPYTLLYGHPPHGVLHILQQSWTGEKPLPSTLGKSEVEYLCDLKKHFDTLRDYANCHTEQAQAVYVNDYNKRAKDKSFEIGEKVIVLFPDSTSKVKSKWQTGIVADIADEYSYFIDLPNGACKQIHANHLRPFTIRVNSVITDADTDFGAIVPLPSNDTCTLPSSIIDREAIAHLAAGEQAQLLDLVDEFASCFSDKPGYCDCTQHEIITLPGFVPKRMKPYRIPEVLKPDVEKQIDILLKDGIIVPSSSPMISPIVCVVKHGAKAGAMNVRIVCDFRYLNKYTQFDPFPVGEQEEVMNKLATSNVISIFDAKAGYWQTPVKPEHRWLLGFATHHGLWEWCRTPFGAKNSGSTFIRAMHTVLKPVRDIATNYVDDMGVGSGDWHSHMVDLRRFFGVIEAAGITLNLPKSEFAKPFVKFVGHVIGQNKKYADPQKVATIQAIPRPATQKKLKSFIAMISYHRSHIARFSELCKPLTDLTSGQYSKHLPWSDEHEQSFLKLKQCLSEIVALTVPRIGGLFILRTDASNYAISGCLYQREDDDIDKVTTSGDGEKPIYFYSQKLSRTQSGWSVIEKEAYAVIASLTKLHHLLFGSQIVVYSDHNPLSYLVDCVTPSAKLMRWCLSLQQYNIVFRYAKANQNRVADFFSRYAAETDEIGPKHN